MWGESSKLCELNCQCSDLLPENFHINSGSGGTKRKQEASSTINYKLKMNPHSIDFSKSPLSPIHTPKRRILGQLQNFETPDLQNFKSASYIENQSFKKTSLGDIQNFTQTSYKEEFQNFKQSSTYVENRQSFKTLGEIQNYKGPSNCIGDFKPTSPYIERLKYSPEFNKSPKTGNCLKSPGYCNSQKENVPINQTQSIGFKSPILGSNSHFGTKSPILGCKSQNSSLTSKKSPLLNSPIIGNIDTNTPAIGNNNPILGKKSPLIANNSPLTTKLKRTSKITRIFEERTKFKMDNKENLMNETFMKFDFEEETRDCSFSGSFQRKTWTSAKLDFTDTLPQKFEPFTVPDKPEDFDDLESLQDLEAEFDSETFDQCTKYEIISTDSPDIISRGRNSTRKVTSTTFNFGAPISDSEASTSFNRPATRMLNFDDDDFEFTSPAVRKTVSVKKSLKFNETPSKESQRSPFNETPTKVHKSKFNETQSELASKLKFNETPSKLLQKSLKFNETPTKLTHQKSDSSIGSMVSPASSRLRLFPSESTTSMESGFISEFEEPFLDIEESNSPKVANFNDLLSGQIKENILTNRNFLKRPTISRSLSFHPESKAKVSLRSILESPEEKKSQKRTERETTEENRSKRRREGESPIQRRPVLQRAFSENNASIMSALARSALEPDLIGDFTQPFSLPLIAGDHSDLKSISCDTLAGLLRGDYSDSVTSFQVIDCRYPYEYEGGHVTGALNVHTPAQVRALLTSPPHSQNRRHLLVFHCEFSIERGPKLSRLLRSSDREKNKENYPQLHYPEIYLLHEGYRSFYNKYPEFCSPSGYTTMLDPKYKDLLRKHRSIQSQPSNLGRRNRLLL